LLMHQNSVAIFCNINQLFGQRVMHTETERERESQRARAAIFKKCVLI
jgi:hypothetical protein